MTHSPITYYKAKEELFNVISHLSGLVLSIAGLVLLVVYASLYGTVWHIVSFSIFGSSMVLLYLASTLYHSARKRDLRRKLNVFDHSAIYLLIAGTYTPFCLVSLNGTMGWVLFGIIWGLALIGISIKLFYHGTNHILSTIGYVLMGWVIVIAAKPLVDSLQIQALVYLMLGGLAYTIGSVFYSIKKIPYNHVTFHFWVLLGSAMHFISIFFYLI